MSISTKIPKISRSEEFHFGGSSHIWVAPTRELHLSHTWAVCEGLPSTIDWMLHVRALPCTWATCELHVSHTWAALEPHVSCMWGAPLHHWLNATCEGITMHVSHTELYVRGSPPPLIECYTWGHYRACEPQVTHVYVHCSSPPSKKSDQKTVRQPHR